MSMPAGTKATIDRRPPEAAASGPWSRGVRLVVLAGAVVVVLLIATGITLYLRPWEEPLTVTGAFGRPPQVTFTEGKSPAESLAAETVIAGKGAVAAQGDLAVVQFASYAWAGVAHRRLESSHDGGRPAVMRIGELIPGLNKGLTGKRIGSRVVMSIPPKDGYGAGGHPETGVTGADTLVYVVDLLATYPKTASARGRAIPAEPGLPQVAAGASPQVTIPASDPPKELRVRTLIEGDGPAIGADQMLITHYQGRVWRSGKVFDSSWDRGEVAPLSSLSGTIPGLVKGLAGKKVGSRVLLVVPPEDGYRKNAPEAGLKDDDTVVFVVDLLGAY
ncbi:FKBP-type peptidyl-prolyl cis-trans isomerase [Nonomuraea sp. NPDC050643]|uniref:FKBP-type peptidyl-prolyl cis-trans isomerase n=1 Tax=Nonomuraea sp. NPDC050643 TaxID=3155660 RepID=UPI0033D2B153